MISKRITGRKDGKSSAVDALKYGAGLKIDRATGKYLDKSHRTRLGGFGLVENGVYFDQDIAVMLELVDLAGLEMQTNCDLNTRVGEDKKLAHFVISYSQEMPTEAVLRDTEDSMLAAMGLDKNHFATFLHSDNGHWHLHLFTSRIEKGEPHRGNSLWHDKINRDKVCREVETRHGLQHDNGLHQIDEHGQIVEIPRAERRAMRDAKQTGISDRAKTTENYSGEKSFQSWCLEIRIGDRLKHTRNWQDLHAAASSYGCQVKAKGAGFVICPIGEMGGIQLSKVGLKNLPAKFGAFQAAKPGHQAQPATAYIPKPTNLKATDHYDKWRVSKGAFNAVKTDLINEQREAHKTIRKDLRAAQKNEIEKIRAKTKVATSFAAVSIAKMEHTVALTALTDRFSHERQALRKQLTELGPGSTFRDYLVKEAAKGDEAALVFAQKCGANEATEVSRKRETDQLKIVAALCGPEYRPAPRLNFTHHIERNGTIIYNLGQGRTITDSAVSKQVQLNDMAANNPEAIAIALRFATSKFGPTLTLNGSKEFQLLAVETAVRNGMFIKFADPTLEQYRINLSEKAFNSRTPKEKQHVERTQKYSDQKSPPANRRDRLHYLSEFNLVSKPASHQVLLQSHVSGGLGERDGGRTQGQHSRLRRIEHDGSEAGRSSTNQLVAANQPINPRVAASFGIRTVITRHDTDKDRSVPKLYSSPGVAAKIPTQQARKADEPLKIIRSISTNVQPLKFKPKEAKKPLSRNLQIGLAVAKKTSKVER